MVEFSLLHLDADLGCFGMFSTLGSQLLEVNTGRIAQQTTAPGFVQEHNVLLGGLQLLSEGRQLANVESRSILLRSNKTRSIVSFST